MVSLSNRRKADLKDLASSLGLSSTGMREDLVERIRNHVAMSGNSALRAQIRDDSPDNPTRPTAVKTSSSTAKSSSLPAKKSRSKVTVDGFDDLDELDDDHPLQEHKVRQFMEHMQGELHQASRLAHQLEDTLQGKFTTGNSAAGRDTVTTTTRFGNRHFGDGNDDHDGDGAHIRRRRESHDDPTGQGQHRHHHHHRHHQGFKGWCRHLAGKMQHCVYDCKAIMMVSRCARRQCCKVQDRV
ncbi:hypothetical protein BGZ72_009643 [Mortierella alpina]|nr:hypothetical protein BGZ72_009643 [Mortierella alpina]